MANCAHVSSRGARLSGSAVVFALKFEIGFKIFRISVVQYAFELLEQHDVLQIKRIGFAR